MQVNAESDEVDEVEDEIPRWMYNDGDSLRQSRRITLNWMRTHNEGRGRKKRERDRLG